MLDSSAPLSEGEPRPAPSSGQGMEAHVLLGCQYRGLEGMMPEHSEACVSAWAGLCGFSFLARYISLFEFTHANIEILELILVSRMCLVCLAGLAFSVSTESFAGARTKGSSV